MKEQVKDLIIDPLVIEQEGKLNFFSCCSFQKSSNKKTSFKKENPQEENEDDLLYISKHQL